MVAGYVHRGRLIRKDPKDDPGQSGRDRTKDSRPAAIDGRLGSPSTADLRFGDQLSIRFDVVFRCEPGTARRADEFTFAGQDPEFDGTYAVVGIRPTARDHRLLLRRMEI